MKVKGLVNRAVVKLHLPHLSCLEQLWREGVWRPQGRRSECGEPQPGLRNACNSQEQRGAKVMGFGKPKALLGAGSRMGGGDCRGFRRAVLGDNNDC